eukprot:TRINITY_DN30828_c0_g1_i1.p1 TRINITY_DN30828_c0_g1~~TRINITY_DN30828_c0_g1_i1.p1  ORF type:complete len:357 (+),score=32.03 TRINITY_DN30828_c0_g1_i1:55-1125(+)
MGRTTDEESQALLGDKTLYGSFSMRDIAEKTIPKVQQVNSWYGEGCFVLALLIFSQVPSVVQTLYRVNPGLFTACSILCASNMVGCIVFPIVFYKDLAIAELRKVSHGEWASLAFSALLYSAIGPAFQLTALQYTSVTTMAVVQRFESVNLIVYSSLFASKTLTTWCKINSVLIVTCILLYLAVSVRSWNDAKGPLFTIFSGWAFSSSLILTKELQRVSIGLVAVTRAVFGTIFYHAMTVVMQTGDEGLSMLYSATLWEYMIWYGLFYVFLGQYVWTIALKECSPVTLSAGVTSLFPLQVFWSVLILGTVPTPSEKIVTVVLVAIVASCAAEIVHNPPESMPKRQVTSDQLTLKGM